MDTRAGVALVFGLATFPLIASIGLAIDYSRLANGRQIVQDMLDASALAGAAAYSMDAASAANPLNRAYPYAASGDEGMARNAATRNFQANMGPQAAPTIPGWLRVVNYADNPQPKVTAAGNTVTVDNYYGVQCLFLGFLRSCPSRIHLTATALNPYVKVNITGSNFTTDAEDWNEAFLYLFRRSAGGDWNYAATPVDNVADPNGAGKQFYLGSNCSPFRRAVDPATGAPKAISDYLTPVPTVIIPAGGRLPTRCASMAPPAGVPNIAVLNGGGVIKMTATWPFGIAMASTVAGNDPSPAAYVAANGKPPPDGLTSMDWPFGYTNQYAAPTFDVPREPNWFFSGLESVPGTALPPNFLTDRINSRWNGTTTVFTGGRTRDAANGLSYPLTGLQTPLNASDRYAGGPSPLAWDYTSVRYNQARPMNCGLQVVAHTFDPGTPLPDPPTTGCFVPGTGAYVPGTNAAGMPAASGGTDSGTLYANMNCSQRGGRYYTYYWNDQGGRVERSPDPSTGSYLGPLKGDDYNYADLGFTVHCDAAGAHRVTLIR